MLSLLTALFLAQAAPDPEVLDRVLLHCEQTGAAAVFPSVDAAEVERALAGGPLPEGWTVLTLPGELTQPQPCWIATRLPASGAPRFVWTGPLQAAITAYVDGAQVWVRGRERDPYWRSDQGFAGFAIPAPLMEEGAPRLMVLKLTTPLPKVRLAALELMDPSSVPQRTWSEGGGLRQLMDAISIVLWAVVFLAVMAVVLSRTYASNFFLLGAIGYAVLVSSQSVVWVPVDHSVLSSASFLGLVLAPPYMGLFFEALYGVRTRTWVRWAAYIQGALAILLFFLPLTVAQKVLGPLLLFIFAWQGYSIFLNVRALRAGDSVARVVVWGYVLLAAFMGFDTVRYLVEGTLGTFIFPLGFFALVISVVVAVGLRFHRMSVDSQRMLGQLQGAAGSLSGIVTALQSASSQLSAATSAQVTALTETATTTTEMNQTSALSAQRSAELIARGVSAAQVVEDGRQAAQTSRASIEAIAGSLLTVADASHELSERVQRVDRIIDTVTFLADQSAALAINASIEASRAGEAGQGFAAVAREVRALANDSRRATAEVREVLAEIRTRTEEVEGQVTRGTQTVHAGVGHVVRLAEVVSSLGGTIDEAVGLMRQVEASARQHQAGVEQVLQAVTNIHRASESIRDGAEQLTSLSREANAVSTGLALGAGSERPSTS